MEELQEEADALTESENTVDKGSESDVTIPFGEENVSKIAVADDNTKTTRVADCLPKGGCHNTVFDENENSSKIRAKEWEFTPTPPGMVRCAKCWTVGSKHTFYGRQKKYCSLQCSRDTISANEEGRPVRQKKPQKHLGDEDEPSQKKPKKAEPKKEVGDLNKYTMFKDRGYYWNEVLLSSSVEGVAVTSFKHVAMGDSWNNSMNGMKIEVPNIDADTKGVFWISTVMKVTGYKAVVRYEGYGTDASDDFVINLCSLDVHHIGWCAANNVPLVPPKSIQFKHADWKQYLVRRLTGSKTLPHDFQEKVANGIQERLKKGHVLEVVDKNRLSCMRVATVDKNVGGRLRLRYQDNLYGEQDEFWCHQDSPLIHPVGWSQFVGHSLRASNEYKAESLRKATQNEYAENEADWSCFKQVPLSGASSSRFQVGMKLEAIDPLDLSSIRVATIMKVLKYNYLMIAIDGVASSTGADWFCYHSSSPCIFPIGFCESNGIKLTPPQDCKLPFNWTSYLKQEKAVAAPASLFIRNVPRHGFRAGMKLEAADLMDPKLICVASVCKVVGRLLRIHFDGWGEDYDQWLDCESPDIYPVGWCEMMNYRLEGPAEYKTDSVAAQAPKKTKKGRFPFGGLKRRKKKQKAKERNRNTNIKTIPLSENKVNTDGTNAQPVDRGSSAVAKSAKESSVYGWKEGDTQTNIMPNQVKTEEVQPIDEVLSEVCDTDSVNVSNEAEKTVKIFMPNSLPNITKPADDLQQVAMSTGTENVVTVNDTQSELDIKITSCESLAGCSDVQSLISKKQAVDDTLVNNEEN